MTLTLMLLISGALIGTGVWLAVREALPTTPVLGDVITNLDPGSQRVAVGPQADTTSDLPFPQRVALAAQARSPRLRTLTAPSADLELLGRTVQQWLGEKLIAATFGLLLLPVLNLLLAAAGTPLPVPFVGVGALTLGAAGWLFPDIDVRTQAANVRAEAAHPVSALHDLLVLEVRAGSSVIQAITRVSHAADSWLFLAIRDELARATLAHRDAWDAVRDLGLRLQLPDLKELGDTLRLGGLEDASIVPALTAKAQSLRDRELNRSQEDANRKTQKLVIPTAGLAFIVLVILLYPSVVVLLGA